MVDETVTILIAEDDEGHATLVRKNLRRAGLGNEIRHFGNGADTLDFLMMRGRGPHREPGKRYLLLLDIRMPGMDGIEVLRAIKSDEELRKIPVIMVTTTDDPREVDRCHALGCSSYVAKPVEYADFVRAIEQLGLFLMIVQTPTINSHHPK